MKVLNIHERELQTACDRVGALIDSLASPQESLWPILSWPRMEFDRQLDVGARGGHGPIRYFVEQYVPGCSVKFRFTGPRGFDGFHGYQTIKKADTTLLRHTLEMAAHGFAIMSWPFIFRPLHDALIEDSLTTAEASLGLRLRVQPWSHWVRVLRWAISGGKARPQRISQQGAPSDVRSAASRL